MLFSENENLVVEHFHYASVDIEGERLFVLFRLNLDNAFLQGSHQGGMVFQDFEQAIDAGELYQGNLSGIDCVCGCSDI